MPVIFSPGDKLENGHYTVLKEIGVGGMGVVYRCRDAMLLRDVAIKMLLPELMSEKTNLDVFWQEARLAAQLEHPNIVTIYNIGVEDRDGKRYHYLSMEYLPGGNLATRLATGALAVEHCLNWMKQLAMGLAFAHKCGVVHQDIKADNIFITNEGDLKVGDFGLARLIAGRAQARAVSGEMGTPAYMSPELCRGEAQDNRSDIYSLGVLFFEMASGQLPYQAKGMVEMAMKHTNAPVPFVRKINPTVPEVLDQLIRKMMAKNPDKRYQSASDILNVLDELIFELRVARLGLRGKQAISAPQSVIDQVEQPRAAGKGATAEMDDHPRQEPAEAPISQTPAAPFSGLTTGPLSPANLPDYVSNERPLSAADERLVSKGMAALNLRWTFKTNGPIGWSSAPVVDMNEKVIYVTSADGYVYAVDLVSGAKLWARSLGVTLISSPLLFNDKLAVLSTTGNVSLLSVKDGSVLWTIKTKSEMVAAPCIHKEVLIAPGFDGKVVAVDLNKGRVKWQYECGEPIVAPAHQYAEQIFLGTKGGTFQSLEFESGKLMWTFQAGGAIAGGSAVSLDTVYFGSKKGVFYAIEARTGRLVWDYTTDRSITSKSVIYFTSVIFCSDNQSIYCCEKYGGRLLWQGNLRGTVLADIVLHGNEVITASRQGWLQCFAINSGDLKWQRELGRCLEGTPLITSQMLCVPTVEGDVLAYAFAGADLPLPLSA